MVSKQSENEAGATEVNQHEKPNSIGIRHMQAALIFGGLVFGYFLRVNMSVAIVAMRFSVRDIWSKEFDHIILSSFFWGYVVAQLPSGLLAQRVGAKSVLAISTALCALFTVIIPAATSWGWIAICCLRCLVGFTQGTVYPCVHTLLAKWAPSTERGVLSTVVYSGAQLGTVIMLASGGALSTSWMGWPSIFYLSGAISFAWAVLYFFLGADEPANVSYISKAEKEYIESLTGSSDNKNMSIPWKAMFTSKSFIALIFAHCGFTWGFYTLLTEIPTYLHTALEMDIQDNGFVSALPYLTMWILSLIISPLSDFLINRGKITRVAGRKIFNSIGQWGPMVCLIALGYMTKETQTLAIFFLTMGVGFNAASLVGYLVNHMDLAPNFAGTMMGITNGISNLLSVFAPIIVGVITSSVDGIAGWRIVFFLTAGFYFVCNLIFVIFGKATIQPWNDPYLPKLSNLGKPQYDSSKF